MKKFRFRYKRHAVLCAKDKRTRAEIWDSERMLMNERNVLIQRLISLDKVRAELKALKEKNSEKEHTQEDQRSAAKEG